MNKNAMEIFKEKIEPTREILRKLKEAVEKDPSILKLEKIAELQRARRHEAGYMHDDRHDVATKAYKKVFEIDTKIRALEENGPYTEAEARIFATDLSLKLVEVEHWAYLTMLHDLLETFTTLNYWQSLQLEVMERGYEYFNRAQYFPEHWKLARHTDTEIRIMNIVCEILRIVDEDDEWKE